jgi:ketosteroid isomerase-like protein
MNPDVLAAEQARAAAMTAGDAAALARWLDDGLVYVHATGVRHDRAQLLHFVATGPRFLAVDFRMEDVLESADCVVLGGELRLRLVRPGESVPIEARSWASAVWRRGPDHATPWRLRLFQSTRQLGDGG